MIRIIQSPMYIFYLWLREFLTRGEDDALLASERTGYSWLVIDQGRANTCIKRTLGAVSII